MRSFINPPHRVFYIAILSPIVIFLSLKIAIFNGLMGLNMCALITLLNAHYL
jgi:hypothetical protein